MHDSNAPAGFGRSAASVLGSSAFSLVLGAIGSVLLARALGPTDRGIYALAILIPSIAALIASLGLEAGVAYHAAKGSYPLDRLYAATVHLALVLGSVGACAGWLAGMAIRGSSLPGVQPHHLALAAATVPVGILTNGVSGLLQGTGRFRAFNILSIIRSAVLALAFGVLLAMGGGVTAAVSAVLGAGVIALAWGLDTAGGLPRMTLPNGAIARALLGYGMVNQLSNVITFLSYRADILVLGVLATPVEVGFYAVAAVVAESLWLVSRSVGTVLFPRIARQETLKGDAEFTAYVSRTTLVLSTINAVSLWLVAPWLIRNAFSTSFEPSVGPLRILLAGTLSLSASRVIAIDLAGRGLALSNAKASGMALTINIALNLALIPRYGASGAAMASAVSYTLTLVARVRVFVRTTGVGPARTLVPQRGDFIAWRHTARNLKRREPS